MRRLSFCFALVAMLLLGATPAYSNSILISTDLIAPGDNLLTYDPSTGLRWLDLTVTVGLSLDQVVSMLEPNGALFGFRYSTLSEVYGLWEHADINTGGLPSEVGSGTQSPTDPTAANYAPIAALQDLVGRTPESAAVVDSKGLVADYDPGTPGDHIMAMARVFEYGPYAGTGNVFATAGRPPDLAAYNFAHWLVEGTFVPFPPPPPPPPASVPDPGSTLLLFGIGLVRLRAWRRRWQ